jgi:hypothetical protein
MMAVDREFLLLFNHTHSIKIYNFSFTLETKDDDRREEKEIGFSSCRSSPHFNVYNVVVVVVVTTFTCGFSLLIIITRANISCVKCDLANIYSINANVHEMTIHKSLGFFSLSLYLLYQ